MICLPCINSMESEQKPTNKNESPTKNSNDPSTGGNSPSTGGNSPSMEATATISSTEENLSPPAGTELPCTPEAAILRPSGGTGKPAILRPSGGTGKPTKPAILSPSAGTGKPAILRPSGGTGKPTKPAIQLPEGDAGNPTKCRFRVNCTDFHCAFPDESHGKGFVRNTICWKIEQKIPCKICNPSQSTTNVLECQFGSKCKYQTSTCKKRHPVSTDTVSPLAPVDLSKEFPELVKRDEEVPVSSSSPSTPCGDSWAKISSMGGAAKTPSPLMENPTKTSKFGKKEVELAISQISMFGDTLPISHPVRGTFASCITFLQHSFISAESFPAYSISKGMVDAIMASMNDLNTLVHKELELLERNKAAGVRSLLLNPALFNIQNHIAGVGSNTTNMCDAYAYALSITMGSNTQMLDVFESQPLLPINFDDIIRRILSCFPEKEEPKKEEPEKNFTFFLTALCEKLKEFQEIEQFRDLLMEVHKNHIIFVNEMEELQKDKLQEEEEMKMSIREFYKNSFKIDIDFNCSIEIEDLFDAVIYLIGTFKDKFNCVSEWVNSHFFKVEPNKIVFFDRLVQAIHAALMKDNSKVLVAGLLSGNFDENFYADHVKHLLTKAAFSTKNYLLRTDDAVMNSIDDFLTWKDRVVNNDLIEFMYSTFETNSREGSLIISKTLDSMYNVLIEYLGITPDASNTPFGQKWIINYRDRKGDQTSEDVSDLIGKYIFDMMVIFKVLVTYGKDSSIRYGNSGVQQKKANPDGLDSIFIPKSISYILDDAISTITESRCSYIKADPDKGISKSVPQAFSPKMMRTVSDELGIVDGGAFRRDVVGHILSKAIEDYKRMVVSGVEEKKKFQKDLNDVETLFTCKNEDDKYLLYRFLSIYLRIPTDKLLMCMVDFIVSKDCKKALVEGFAFIDDRNDTSDVMRMMIENVVKTYSTKNTTEEIKETVDKFIVDIRAAIKFIISSGITLSEVSALNTIIKDLFNANKDMKKNKFVFINGFGVALMAAASKMYELNWNTMYSIMIGSLNHVANNKFFKESKCFKGNQFNDVEQLRCNGFRFNGCVRPTPNCTAFCDDACSSVAQKPSNIDAFKELVSTMWGIVAFSNINTKESTGLIFSLSAIIERIIMLCITDQRERVLGTLDLTDPIKIKNADKEKDLESIVINGILPSLSSKIIKVYFESLSKYFEQNRVDIGKYLDEPTQKELRKMYRMQAVITSFFDLMRSIGILTDAEMAEMKDEEFQSSLYTEDRHGRKRFDPNVVALAMTAFTEKFSQNFYLDLLSMIKRALYPNYEDILRVRKIMRQLYDEQKECRQMEKKPVVEGNGESFVNIAFGRDTAIQALEQFMSLIDKSVRQIVDDRMKDYSVLLMSMRFQDLLLNCQNMKDIEDLSSEFTEIMTKDVRNFFNDMTPTDVNALFFDMDTFIENVFFDEEAEDEEDEDIDLSQFREMMLDKSSTLFRAFDQYVRAAIDEFDDRF